MPPLFWGWVRFPSCLLAFLAFRPGGGGGYCPCLSAWLSGCSQETSKCTPVPGLPALLRHRGNCPGWGACLGSSVKSSPQVLCGLRHFPFFSSPTGPIATGSPRRRLILTLSQKDALQALFQQNPSPGIATRERLARELGIDKSRVQVDPHLSTHSPFQALHTDPRQLKAAGGLPPEKEFSLPLGLVSKPTKTVKAEPTAI